MNRHGKLSYRSAVVSSLLCLLVWLTDQTQLYAQQLPTEFTPFEIEYEVGNNLINAGSARLSLVRKGDEWIYSLTTKPSGIFKLTGKGKIQEISVIHASDDSASLPQRYTYRQDEEERRSVDAWFNWDDNEIKYKKRGEEVIEAFNDPILDRLSVTLAIMEQLRTGFDRAELEVFDNGRIKSVVFENEKTEMADTRLGKTEVIRVRSYKKGENRSRETVTWFAPAFGYVPVKIEQHKRGKLVARLTLTKLKNAATEQ
ncbi:MAG: DUF3108 domain-containing protein [Gammaproteobacteria bacterium]|nr:DUF3108 domain-containing protein [Gammaproteobacteria bacterium]